LRHTAITTALRRTNNLEAARVLAGHAKVATTQLYLDDSAGMESLAVAAMEGDFK
jgi:site-specific recombinase XerC